MASRHDWLSWDQYLAAHYSNLMRFPQFILRDGVIPAILPSHVIWSGKLECEGDIEIYVTKKQDVRERNGRREVRTVTYSYHALLRRDDGAFEDILRYNNAHPHEGHPDGHHKHLRVAGEPKVVHIGEAGWPTLADVIAEVEDWWQAAEFRA